MKRYFGYIRVSTQRQGAHGVSLQEQRGAIEAYAKRTGLTVIAWYEERETAAKRGRRVFAQMLKELTKGKAEGIIIHKIDRSARNLRDWADLGELIDHGVDVHFAHDALDLRSRGGRLSADIQAVVAADFIRNLREETRKGFYGRLKQGLYPLRAPVGYRDMGRGKPKEIDPVRGPLVREAFTLYATGEWNFHGLRAELEQRGLRGWRGAPLSLNGLTTMLNNPFYIGLVHIRKTGEMFEGKHEPLVSKTLYDRVQTILRGRRAGSMPTRHDFMFRRLIRCAACGRHLTGERHKGRFVYYRCHGQACQGVSLGETRIDAYLRDRFALLTFDPAELKDLKDMVDDLRAKSGVERAERGQGLRLQLAQLEERLARLTDALIDGALDKEAFAERKAGLLLDKRNVLERLEKIDSEPSVADIIAEMFERTNTAYITYESDDPFEKRETVESLSSNFVVEAKSPAITLKSPFQELLNYRESYGGDPHRDTVRIRTQKIFEIFKTAAERKYETRDERVARH